MAEQTCTHAVPQAADQLHGICIFCYRDRLAAVRAENAALRERVKVLERVREAAKYAINWVGDARWRHPLFLALQAAKEKTDG